MTEAEAETESTDEENKILLRPVIDVETSIRYMNSKGEKTSLQQQCWNCLNVAKSIIKQPISLSVFTKYSTYVNKSS